LAGHFLDSSALGKLYHAEGGTPIIERIINAPDNVEFSRLSVAELTSAFAIKVRTHSINRDDAYIFLRQFRGDVAIGKLEVFSIGESEFAMTELLVERYAFDLRLRAPGRPSTGRGSGIAKPEVGGSFCRSGYDTLRGFPTGGVLGNQPEHS
jgi:hypothetical protein